MTNYGKPLPIRYGAARVVGRLIDYADFTPEHRTDPSPLADRFSSRRDTRKETPK